MNDRELEHPAITRTLRDGCPNGYTAEPETLDVGEAEFIEMVMKRKAPDRAVTPSEAKEI